MSQDVNCETCGEHGRVRSGMTCPEDWYWAEVVDHSSKEKSLLMACSEKCARLDWHKRAAKRTDVNYDFRAMEVLTKKRTASHLVPIEEGDTLSVDSVWYRVGPKGEGLTQIESPYKPED